MIEAPDPAELDGLEATYRQAIADTVDGNTSVEDVLAIEQAIAEWHRRSERARVAADIAAERERQEQAERTAAVTAEYEHELRELVAELDGLAEAVDGHLSALGCIWTPASTRKLRGSHEDALATYAAKLSRAQDLYDLLRDAGRPWPTLALTRGLRCAEILEEWVFAKRLMPPARNPGHPHEWTRRGVAAFQRDVTQTLVRQFEKEAARVPSA